MVAGKRARIPQDVINNVMETMLQDPQLPRPNPTEAFWQLPASGIAHHQSAELPKETTYAIIGSGVTGCSVAKNLLENFPVDSKSNVTVLEARALTSGATGRNGGHLVSPIPEEFLRMAEAFGQDEALKIAKFADRTLESMHSLASSGGPELERAAEARRVQGVSVHYDKDAFEQTKRSLETYSELVPDFKSQFNVYTPQEGIEKLNVKSTAGVFTYSAGAFWPYRMITLIWAQLLKDYKERLSIETETAVSKVEYDRHNTVFPYLLTTSRGNLRAAKVIYCTNGWTGHLLPKLRGKIFPLRGTMSCQEAGPDLPREGDQRSWSTMGGIRYDPTDQSASLGLYYITQNALTGDVFVGGENEKLSDILTSDDSRIGEKPRAELEAVLPKIFAKGWPEGEKPNVRKIWSGVLGMTPDFLPLVGQLSKSVTGRQGDGEWIAAGYNGYGMPLCWGCGEAIAKMLLGKKAEVDEWLPGSFLLTNKRLNSPYLTREAAVAVLLEQNPSWMTTARLACRHAIGLAYRAVFG